MLADADKAVFSRMKSDPEVRKRLGAAALRKAVDKQDEDTVEKILRSCGYDATDDPMTKAKEVLEDGATGQGSNDCLSG